MLDLEKIHEKDNIEDTKKLHEAVKHHPYRINQDETLKQEYKNLLRELMYSAYFAAKNTYGNNITFKALSAMFHDFCGSIRSLNYKNTNVDNILHIELCINTIHQMIDTGIIKTYHTYYTGGNISKHMPRKRKYTLIDGKYISNISIESLNNYIKELEQEGEKRKLANYELDYINFCKQDIIEKSKMIIDMKTEWM